MEKKSVWVVLSMVAIWAAVALIGIFGPSFQAAGTAIPLSAIIAPIFGALSTGFIAMWAMSP